MLSHHMCSLRLCRLHGHERETATVKVAFGTRGDAEGLQDICRMEVMEVME